MWSEFQLDGMIDDRSNGGMMLHGHGSSGRFMSISIRISTIQLPLLGPETLGGQLRNGIDELG